MKNQNNTLKKKADATSVSVTAKRCACFGHTGWDNFLWFAKKNILN